MSAIDEEFLAAIEGHDPGALQVTLDNGLDTRAPIRGRSPIQWLTEMYTRSDRFPECLRLLLDRGAVLDDPALVPVLLDDADGLAAALRTNPSWIRHRTSLVSAFTPLVGVSLLHVAAEYGNVKAARVLIEMGADIEARAALDDFGLDGHTSLFHTVHSHDNRSLPVLRLLLDAGAKPDVRVAGITWGRGFEWETTCFDVTPISYAQLGLLPQMHRRDHDIYDNIRRLLLAAGRTPPPLENVPNRYLKPRSDA